MIGRMLFQERTRAESFGELAELYDRIRPSYPPALVQALLADGPGSVLDVGCGTGIAGALLAERGCAVLGVEIDERMAERARARGLDVEVSAFERWEAAGRRFELLISGQAWHWIDPVAGVAKAAEVLEEGGRIELFWNFGDPPSPLAERLASIYARLEPGLERYSVLLGNHGERAEPTLAAIAASGLFGAAQTRAFPWSREYATADWIDFLQTHSDHRALARERRERLLSAVGEAIDALGGSFEMPYRTVLVSARRAVTGRAPL
jgi:SAM-dependent methyltransferase